MWMNHSIRTSRSPRTNHISILARGKPKHASNSRPVNIHSNSYWETALTIRSFLPWFQIKLQSGSGRLACRTCLDSDQNRALANLRHFLDLPAGLFPATPVHPLSQKYFCSRLTQITFTSIAVPSRSEGRIAIVTNAGRIAVDVMAPLTNGAKADGEVVWS